MTFSFHLKTSEGVFYGLTQKDQVFQSSGTDSWPLAGCWLTCRTMETKISYYSTWVAARALKKYNLSLLQLGSYRNDSQQEKLKDEEQVETARDTRLKKDIWKEMCLSCRMFSFCNDLSGHRRRKPAQPSWKGPAPRAAWCGEASPEHNVLREYTMVRLHWGTAQLFLHPIWKISEEPQSLCQRKK